MKKSTLIGIILISSFLIVSCAEKSPVETKPLPSADDIINGGDVEHGGEGEGETEMLEIFIDSKAGLTEILGLDFTDIKIIDIWCEEVLFHNTSIGSSIYLFCTASEDILLNSIFKKGELDDIGITICGGTNPILDEMGINITDVQAYWIHFKEINNGDGYIPYTIEIFLLKEPRDDGSNAFMFAGPSAKVTIDVEKIMAE